MADGFFSYGVEGDGGGEPISGTLAFLEVPVLEKSIETAGRIILNGKLWKALPFAKPLERLLRSDDEEKKTKQQEKDDGTKVVKVHDAIKIVQDELDGLVGFLNNAGSVAQWFQLFQSGSIDPTTGKGLPSVSGRICLKIRNKALEQKRERVPCRVVPPLKPGRPIGGSASDGGYPSRRRGAPGSKG